MPTKTDRILTYLPGTFRALPRPNTLYSVVDAFGNELQQAENASAAIMLAHWPGLADHGADFVQDLACIASLYGLAPRGATPIPVADEAECPPLATDETVEQFREHLFRYVRTFLEGTTTVQGILRIVAEALGLHIADDYGELDTWWTRGDDALVTTEPRGDDAVATLFGARTRGVRAARGAAPSPASVTGRADLRGGAELHGAARLRVAVDGGAPVDIDLAAHADDPPATFAANVAKAIGDAVPALSAQLENGRLALASRTTGPASSLDVLDTAGDAAPALLGLAPRTYHGSAATRASVTGTVALDGGVDFSAPDAPRYVRLLVDGTRLFELDCAGAPAHRTPAEITAAINAQAGFALASNDGRFLTLSSPSTGFAGSIAFKRAAAQDAVARLFGAPPLLTTGRDAQPARRAGTQDGSAGYDLSAGSRIEIAVDGAPPVTIDCAGAMSAATQLNEIVHAIDTALGTPLAEQDGHVVTLRSQSAGPGGELTFLAPPSGDATATIFGVAPRAFSGAPALPARVTGTPDLSGTIDAGATPSVRIALDGAPARTVDLRAAAPFDNKKKSRLATPQQLCNAIDAAFGTAVATTDGQQVTLTSPSAGAASRVAVLPLDVVRERRFVTRAFITDDAASLLFGFPRALATGSAPSKAKVEGSSDLSRGVDLSAARALRIALDGGPFVEVDCALKSPRPRAALVTEIEAALDAQLGKGVASTDGRTLALTSPSAGAASRITFAPAGSALGVLFGGPVASHGTNDAGVAFAGTADLAGGVDLSAADHVAIGIDGAPPVEISCAGPDPAHTSLNQICVRINTALHAGIASSDGKHVVLTSPQLGTASGIEIGVPAGADATKAILGISGPRSYHGTGKQPARIAGVPVTGPLDLRAKRFLTLAVDGGAVLDVDCAGADPKATKLDEIVSAVNAAVPNLAAHDGSHVMLTSATTGVGSRIDLVASAIGDARTALFGNVQDVTTGTAAGAAALAGTMDLLAPVNLAAHSVLRLAVDGAEPFDVDVAGTAPDRTALDEIVAKINAVSPGLASATDHDRLQLTSPGSGDESRIELYPVRALELVDYPPAWRDEPEQLLHVGERLRVKNDGAHDSSLELTFRAPSGVEGAELVDLRAGLRLRLATPIGPGESVRVRAAKPAGVSAERRRNDGTVVAIPPGEIVAAPLGVHAFVPFAGERQLRRVGAGDEALVLDDARAAYTVQLHALGGRADVAVRVSATADARRFDVEIAYAPAFGPPVVETYGAVAIGAGSAAADSLATRVNATSQIVRAVETGKGAVLRLARGTASWVYTDCDSARFDWARFGESAFPGGGACNEYGIFDVSAFASPEPPPLGARFGPPPPHEPPVAVRARWRRFAAGAFAVNLPADLPDEFGARFDRGRFATAGAAPETYDGVVFDPRTDADSFENRIKSKLVTVKHVDSVPIGFEGFVMPFRQPRERFLSLGSAHAPARLYLTEAGVAGFYELTAAGSGTWGNAIAVTARKAGPARFDVTIGFEGARFENGRIIALAGSVVAPGDDPLPALTAQILKPRPVGVLQAKAAGIQATVTRDRTEPIAVPSDEGDP